MRDFEDTTDNRKRPKPDPVQGPERGSHTPLEVCARARTACRFSKNRGPCKGKRGNFRPFCSIFPAGAGSRQTFFPSEMRKIARPPCKAPKLAARIAAAEGPADGSRNPLPAFLKAPARLPDRDPQRRRDRPELSASDPQRPGPSGAGRRAGRCWPEGSRPVNPAGRKKLILSSKRKK